MPSRLLALLLLLAPVAACAVAPDEDVAASAGAIEGAVSAGATLRTTARLNLREAPSATEDILLTLPEGAIVTAVGGSAVDGYYEVSYEGTTGWASGAYLSASTDEPGEATGTFDGRRHTGVTMLWQGDWSFLLRCDSYSRRQGRVVFFCDESPSRAFVDEQAWIAVPRAYFSRGLCGQHAKVCKGERCVVAKVVEKSETTSKWEGSTAVMEALGVEVGSSGCSSSYGSARGVTVTME